MSTPELKLDTEIRVFQCLAIRSGLRALQKGMQVNRAYTSTNCRRMATKFTGKAYKAGQKGLAQAEADLTELLEKLPGSQIQVSS